MANGYYDLQHQYQHHAQVGELTERLATARRMWDAFPDRRNYTWALLAASHAAMGDLDLAAQVLRQALDANLLWRLSLLDLPDLEIVRRDPRCQSVIEQASRRIEAKHYRPLVIVERPSHGGIAPLLLHLHGANSTAAWSIDLWRGASRLGWTVAAGPIVATERRGPLLLGSASGAHARGPARDCRHASGSRPRRPFGFLSGSLSRSSGGPAERHLPAGRCDHGCSVPGRSGSSRTL
jgi:hypothetical protein